MARQAAERVFNDDKEFAHEIDRQRRSA
jgi:hypothetical protein